MKERDPTVVTDGEVGTAVVIVIAHGAAHGDSGDGDAGLRRDVLKAAVAEVAEERGMAVAVGVGEKNAGAAIAVKIEDARAGAERSGGGILAQRWVERSRVRRQAGIGGDVREMDRARGRNRFDAGRNFFDE